MATKNLFANAKKESVTKAATKDKEEIDLTLITDGKGKQKYPGAAQLLVDFQKYHAQKAEAEAMLKTKGEEIKEIGLDIWVEKFEKNGKRPESFIMKGMVEKVVEGTKETIKEEGRLMFISSDSYKKIDEIAGTVLESKYGCIERKEVFFFDNDLLQKYGEVISEAILNIKGMTDEEKANLIKKKEEISIKKGTIENVQLIESITGKVEKPKKVAKDAPPVFEKFSSVRELISKVEPTFSLKNC